MKQECQQTVAMLMFCSSDNKELDTLFCLLNDALSITKLK
jgi:hypothetical protein